MFIAKSLSPFVCLSLNFLTFNELTFVIFLMFCKDPALQHKNKPEQTSMLTGNIKKRISNLPFKKLSIKHNTPKNILISNIILNMNFMFYVNALTKDITIARNLRNLTNSLSCCHQITGFISFKPCLEKPHSSCCPNDNRYDKNQHIHPTKIIEQ